MRPRGKTKKRPERQNSRRSKLRRRRKRRKKPRLLSPLKRDRRFKIRRTLMLLRPRVTSSTRLESLMRLLTSTSKLLISAPGSQLSTQTRLLCSSRRRILRSALMSVRLVLSNAKEITTTIPKLVS